MRRGSRFYEQIKHWVYSISAVYAVKLDDLRKLSGFAS